MSVKFQTKTAVPHWTDEFYRRINASDPSSVELWAEDAYIECANFPPTYSKRPRLPPDAAFPASSRAFDGSERFMFSMQTDLLVPLVSFDVEAQATR